MANFPRGRNQRQRNLSHYLLDKSLQLRYIGFVTVLSAVICGALGYLILKQESRASSSILETMADLPGGGDYWAETQAAINAKLQRDDSNLVLVMGGVAVGLVLVLSLYLLIMTHKVAGPLYKVSGYFERMTEGRLGDTWPLRHGDMLQDFYGNFKEMHDAVRARFQADNALIERFIACCEAEGVAGGSELANELARLSEHQRLRESQLADD